MQVPTAFDSQQPVKVQFYQEFDPNTLHQPKEI
jgi:hypothetical protein